MRGVGLAGVVGFAAPVDGWLLVVADAFPPRLVVGGDADVGEDRVRLDRRQRVRVRLLRRARGDAEEAGLRVDRVQAAILTRSHPADVVADGPDLPTGLAVALQIGRASCRATVG